MIGTNIFEMYLIMNMPVLMTEKRINEKEDQSMERSSATHHIFRYCDNQERRKNERVEV